MFCNGGKKMSWENILKRPLPINARSDRDNQYREKIIAYEETRIEPTFENIIQNLPAGESRSLTIFTPFNQPEDKVKNRTYEIGTNAVNALGQDRRFILNVIKEIYTKEGYTVEGPTQYESGYGLEIHQP